VVDSTGWALTSYVIFKATKYSQEGYFETLPDDWRIDISDKGWTTDKIGMNWLNHFIPYTNGRTMGRYQILILDGHGSILQFLTDNMDNLLSSKRGFSSTTLTKLSFYCICESPVHGI
jgi:hypothetical protein